ncbi:MAG: GDSL-type esterase/lipase family protein [Gimesia chilikensis]
MIHRAATFLLTCALLTGMHCTTDSLAAAEPATIVTFGDSTTATRGPLVVYSMILAKELPQQGVPVKVINAGIGGNTTQNAVARFEKDVLAKQPDLVVIQFGQRFRCRCLERSSRESLARISETVRGQPPFPHRSAAGT